MIYNPYRTLKLVGNNSITVVTVPMRVERVREMLPEGLSLTPSLVCPRGWHPLRFYFNRVELGMNGMPGFPYINYNEQVLGIPNVLRAGGTQFTQPVGPYLYMPRVFVDSPFAIAGGVLIWGMQKRYGRFDYATDTLGEYWPGRAVDADPATDPNQQRRPHTGSVHVDEPYLNGPTLTLDWKVAGLFSRATREFDPFASSDTDSLLANFPWHRQAMNQPLILQWPMGIGPWLVAGLFQQIWPRARIRSVMTQLTICREYVPGLLVGTYRSGGLARHPLGSYQLQCPWAQWMPYSPYLADWVDESGDRRIEQDLRLMTGPYRPRLGTPPRPPLRARGGM